MRTIKLENKSILVTGAAGFIGAELVKRLCQEGENIIVVGIDNLNDYYDVSLKEYRLKELKKYRQFIFRKGTIADKQFVAEIFKEYKPHIVVNLAAQAGVRYSIVNPDTYIESNLIGFYNILEACRHSYDNNMSGVEHLVYASSSSIYGSNESRIIRYRYMRRLKRQTNYWLMRMQSFLIFHARVFAFLLYMDLPVDRIWLILDLQIKCEKGSRFKYSIMEIVKEILLTLKTLLRGW